MKKNENNHDEHQHPIQELKLINVGSHLSIVISLPMIVAIRLCAWAISLEQS